VDVRTEPERGLGVLLRGYRFAAGLTQEELARQSGLSIRALSDMERGRTARPNRDSLQRLADALELTEPARAQLMAARRRSRTEAGLPRSAGRHAGQVLPVPRQLPASVRHFAGRAAELRVLDDVLDQVACAGDSLLISVITGTAGVGKTALAVQWGHRVAERFPDGQLYVDLRGFDPFGAPVTPASALGGFLAALGVPPGAVPAGADAQEGLYRSLLAGRRMLIILDNARDAAQVRPLLPGNAACSVIVTSRNTLAGLAAAEGAHLLSLDVLTDAEARELLSRRLGPERAQREPAAVSELAGLCAGLPLALAIAAARAAAAPCRPLIMLAGELRHAQDRLGALDAGDAVTSVRAVFSWSYQNLSEPSARMFRLLGVHPGPDVSTPAAASLAGAGLNQAREALRELVTASLLGEHSPGRYAFHDLLRAYAAEQAAATEDVQARRVATGRMLGHYLHTAYAAALLLKPSREPVILAPPQPGVTPEDLAGYRHALDWFEAEHQVLLAVVSLAAEAGFDACAWQLPAAMGEFLDWRGHWQEYAAIQRTALAAATRLEDTAGQAIAGRALGLACALLADYDQALALMTSSLGLYRELGDRGGQARVHQSLGWVATRQGRRGDALGHAEQALALFEAVADRAGQAAALNNAGLSHAMLGDPRRARALCRQALALNQELGTGRGEAHAWDSLGYVEHQLGHYGDAAGCYQNALRLIRELGDRLNEAQFLTHLGDARHANIDQQAALDAWQQALDILDDLHHPDADQVRAKLKHLGTD
jgi:tetratricopeptide (TPR) repeat protein/transcriptional regulator with XRE-family HTH domain